MKHKKRKFKQKKRESKKQRNTKKTSKSFETTITVFGRGEGVVVLDGVDYIVPNEYLGTALDGDLVSVSPVKERRQNIAQVTKILKRNKTKFVGVLKQVNKKIVFDADNKRMYLPVTVTDIDGSDINSKVAVQITSWENNIPHGKIIAHFGKVNEHTAEINSILFEHEVETSFSDGIHSEAQEFVSAWESIKQHELNNRRDIRNVFTITIDPHDAKDFDDAISLVTLPNGNYQIGIHIADVSHFVTPNSLLDVEAKRRAFSVYLVDRTIPMLPEELSNNLCSLVPHEDRLAFSSIFEVNNKGEVIDEWFGKTIINSAHRFTYEEAQRSIESSQSVFHSELNTLNTIAKNILAERSKAGSIDFADSEVSFNLDENGSVIDITKKIRLDSHRLVEEYMLLANKHVAQFMERHLETKTRSEVPQYFLYRIHDLPHQERMQTFSLFVRALGYSFPEANRVTADDITSLLHKVSEKPEAGVLRTAALRTMSKAVYATQNIGHFGLAFDAYTHFTSPIRRYADLTVHRLLLHALEHTNPPKKMMQDMSKLASHISNRELDVVDAERQSIRFKQVEYMQRHVGETRDGIISGITEWGMYIEDAETKTEGMVPLRTMEEDHYDFDRKTYSLVGRDTGTTYRLGSPITFIVSAVRLEERQIDFSIKK